MKLWLNWLNSTAFKKMPDKVNRTVPVFLHKKTSIRTLQILDKS